MIDKILNWQSGSDIEEWEKTLLESKNPRNLYIASHYIKDLDIEKIENELLNLQDEKYLHNFFVKILKNFYLKFIQLLLHYRLQKLFLIREQHLYLNLPTYFLAFYNSFYPLK